jgi:curved DNA-binding protein CbpA
VRTWYDVLGVRPDASDEELRASYRSQVRALHPDSRQPSVPPADADAALRLVNQAWEVLGDPARRAAYDEGLEEAGVRADEEPWALQRAHGGPRFPWWIVVVAVLLVIFVFTAYAGTPTPAPPN